jgi:hypothetical protein
MIFPPGHEGSVPVFRKKRFQAKNLIGNKQKVKSASRRQEKSFPNCQLDFLLLFRLKLVALFSFTRICQN